MPNNEQRLRRLLCYRQDLEQNGIAPGKWSSVWDPEELNVYGQSITLELTQSDEATATVNGWPVPGPMLVVEPGDLVRVRRGQETLLCIGRAMNGRRIEARSDSASVDTFTGLPIGEGIEALGCSRCGAVYAPATVDHLNARCAACGHSLTIADVEDQPDCIEDGWL